MNIHKFTIKENQKNEIMIAFDCQTKKINEIELMLFNVDFEQSQIELKYYIGDIHCFSYYLGNVPAEQLKLIESREIILIDEQEFYYYSINSKKF
jgi:hypothetical protein